MRLKYLLVLLLTPLCIAQTPTGAHRISQVLVKGNALNANVGPFASITVCVANTGCATGATIYSDQALTVPIQQPLVANGSGNYDYYIASGCVDEQISSPGSQAIFIPNVCPFNGVSGGGAGNPAPPAFAVQLANAGVTSFQGDGFININPTTHTLTSRINNGVSNANSYRTSNATNDGIANFIASTDCNSVSCAAMVPPTSNDASTGTNQAGNSTTNSVSLFDQRYNAFGMYNTNPLPSGFGFNFVIQSGFPAETAYTVGSKSAIQGAEQDMRFEQALFINPGYVTSGEGCPFNCPAAGYTSTAQWQIQNVLTQNNFFPGAGVRGIWGQTNNFTGIGDASVMHFNNLYAGGAISASDEGIHGLGESNISTPADWQGTITSLTDPSHFVANQTASANTQGVGRYMIDRTATPLLSLQLTANIFSPTNTAPFYGTVVFDASTPALPVSYAQGSLVNDCVVPIQEGTVAQTSCTVHATTGTFTATGAGPGGDQGLFCAAQNTGGNMIFGAQVLSATAKDGSGNQILTLMAHRSVHALGVGSNPTMAAQGGACGTVVSLNGDTNSDGTLNGSVIPVIVSPSPHTVGYAHYNSSQLWSSAVAPGSSARTEAIFGVPNVGVAPGSFQATNVSRTNNVLTGTIDGDENKFSLVNTFVVTVSGCSDSSVNTGIGGAG
ncbi:hypothetical protein [Tunturiibacter gelidiferens]|uniref:hypothetical protein n=1 Tax=Tunturiibacter gelidiferens TaxID=3069689 RepID=UPI003D9BDC28